ncbi:MAG: alpha/beta hydrolase [Chitinophagaceae bacterium]|nr:MAG: alpha/beta hydrolase [Chitinophagaceae bacterium]
MFRFFSFCLGVCMLSTFANAQTRPATDSLVFTEFYSKILNEKRRIIVHLPLNYTKELEKKYPVMYLLDGGSQDIHTADKISTLAGAETIPECIIVGIMNTKASRSRDQTPPFMQLETEDINSPLGKADQFLAFIEKELLPKIDSSYRTSAYKTLAGHSRGGLFVLYSLIEKPNLFNAFFCYSTPIWRFDDIMIKKIEHFVKNTKLTKQKFLFLSVGADETENIRGGFKRLNEMLSIHSQKKLWVRTYLTPYANHQQNPLFATSKGLKEWGIFYTQFQKSTQK